MRGTSCYGPPPLPLWHKLLRGVAILLAAGAVGASAYALNVFNDLYNTVGYYVGPSGLTIFNGIVTFLFLLIAQFFESFAPHLYYRQTIASVMFVEAVFWLISGGWSAYVTVTAYHFFADPDNTADSEHKYAASMAASAGLSGGLCLLLVVLGLNFLRACRHTPGEQSADTLRYREHGAELVTFRPKYEGQEPPPPAYAPPQQQYSQQQYPQQHYPMPQAPPGTHQAPPMYR